MPKQEEKPQENVQANPNPASQEAQEAGYVGTKVDPRPNSDYTVAGVTGGTDKAPKQASRE